MPVSYHDALFLLRTIELHLVVLKTIYLYVMGGKYSNHLAIVEVFMVGVFVSFYLGREVKIGW